MKRGMILLAIAPIAGCTVDLNTTGTCRDDRAQGYVGQVYSDAIADRIKVQSRATKVRPIRPGDVVTMDVNTRRVNVSLDENNRVTRIYCG
ncbi:I78 family peptidase inhibitor [Sphingomonas floccifaciens]|uniref:I78 family peptidase inhibitor n=1 Tax=Sphingomonas floccifaciens TaxID=1844115 RepID=A0ABW4NAX6_9SPHN